MSSATRPDRRHRVLVVDADPAFADSLRDAFGTRTIDVEISETAADAVARVAAAAPDMVVLDLDLRDGAALALLRRWRAESPALPVILVSGIASLTAVVDALNEGARRFLPKPVDVTALLATLDGEPTSSGAFLSPHFAADHHLGTAALQAEGVDRFFAISPGLLAIIGFDGHFKMLNPAWEKTLGYSIDELCAQPHLDLIHPDDREKARDQAIETRAGQTVFRFTIRYRCKDGSYRSLAWSATPSPEHRLVYASARDVTSTVRMEQGLRKSNALLVQTVAEGHVLLRESAVENDALVALGRYKDEVAALLVHDMKNPLSVIVSNYDYILDAFDGSADIQEALRDSQDAGRRMLRLLENLVDVSRLERGTLVTAPAPLSVSALMRRVADQRRITARARQISIGVVPSPDLMVSADADLLTRALENIVDNALRYTPTGGMIELWATETPPYVDVRIGNSGDAIPIGSRRLIFDKFSQLSDQPQRANLGLGLYFCRLVAEAQGGAISVEETARLPTVFCVRLPGSSVVQSVGQMH